MKAGCLQAPASNVTLMKGVGKAQANLEGLR
jgi:hypothetical protein